MDATLEVCPDAKVSNVCQRAGCTNPARRKYCCDACRQKAYYWRPGGDGEWRQARGEAWRKARLRYKAITFDPVHSGPLNDIAGRKGQFGFKPDGTKQEIKNLLKTAILNPKAGTRM